VTEQRTANGGEREAEDERQATARGMKETGASLSAIARGLGVSKSTVWEWCGGVRTRDGGERSGERLGERSPDGGERRTANGLANGEEGSPRS
jgi:transposase-like protein